MAYAIRMNPKPDFTDILLSIKRRADRCNIYVFDEITINLRKDNSYNIQIVIQQDGSILLDRCPWADIGYHELEPIEDIDDIEKYVPELLNLVYWKEEK